MFPEGSAPSTRALGDPCRGLGAAIFPRAHSLYLLALSSCHPLRIPDPEPCPGLPSPPGAAFCRRGHQDVAGLFPQDVSRGLVSHGPARHVLSVRYPGVSLGCLRAQLTSLRPADQWSVLGCGPCSPSLVARDSGRLQVPSRSLLPAYSKATQSWPLTCSSPQPQQTWAWLPPHLSNLHHWGCKVKIPFLTGNWALLLPRGHSWLVSPNQWP